MNFKKIIMILVVFSSVSVLAAQERLHFNGTINSNLEVQMELHIEDKEVSGHYFYFGFGGNLNLSGTIDEEKNIIVNELDNNKKVTGTFTGKLEDNVYSGKWSNGKRTFDFKLDLFANSADYKIDIDNYCGVDISFPYFLNLSKLKYTIYNEVSVEAESFMEEALSWYPAECFGYTKNKGYSIPFYNRKLLSISWNNYEYTGGAHGNTLLLSSNYLMKNNKNIGLDLKDIFKENSSFQNIISELLLVEFKNQEAEYVVDGSVTVFEYDALKAWSFTPKGLSFGFDPYYLAPYYMGCFYGEIPYSKIKDIMKPEILAALSID